MNIDPQAANQILSSQLEPWHQALADPAAAQEAVLHRLLGDYAKTQYGVQNGAANIEDLDDYRKAFPIADYDNHFKAIIDRVMSGEVDALVPPPA